MSDNGSTNISYQETRSDAAVVKDCSNQMGVIFSNFESIMKRIGGTDVYVGDANESLQTRFGRLKTRFIEYTRTVDEFYSLIMSAADSEETTERQLSQEAEELASSEHGA